VSTLSTRSSQRTKQGTSSSSILEEKSLLKQSNLILTISFLLFESQGSNLFFDEVHIVVALFYPSPIPSVSIPPIHFEKKEMPCRDGISENACWNQRLFVSLMIIIFVIRKETAAEEDMNRLWQLYTLEWVSKQIAVKGRKNALVIIVTLFEGLLLLLFQVFEVDLDGGFCFFYEKCCCW